MKKYHDSIYMTDKMFVVVPEEAQTYERLDDYIAALHHLFKEEPGLKDFLYDLQEKACEREEEEDYDDELGDIF